MRLFCVLSLFILAACASFTAEKQSDGIYTIKYQESQYKPDYYDAVLPPAFIYNMQQKAQETCPKGYEKIREYHKSLPSRGSYYAWDIRCLR